MLFTIASLISSIAFAGSDSTVVQNDSLIDNEFQISFITPMGTPGTEFEKMRNKVSINIFAGHHGALDGVEIGGFANSIKHNAEGVQIAGFANAVQGNLEGAQFSGFANYANRVEGGQISGFANVAKDSLEGVQITGFANYAHKGFEGVQASGFTNISKGDLEGIQATGFANIATGKVKGIQASGFYNYAKSLDGIQVSFLNFTDSIEDGLMIGFLSFAKNGYHKWELESNESSSLNLAFKTGTNSFYNIFSTGAIVKDESLFWNFGYGIGSLIKFNNSAGVNIDLTAHHVSKDDFEENLNLMTKLKPSFFYQFHKYLTIYGGPSLNFMISEIKTNGETTQNSDFITNPFYEKSISDGDFNLKAYLGFQAGLRF